MPAKRWSPGPKPATGKRDDLCAIARTLPVEAIIFKEEKEPAREPGDEIRLVMMTHIGARKQTVSINLTMMTEQELEAFEKLANLAIAWARPIVIDRDRQAREDLEIRGDDINPRNYRQIPQLVVRRVPRGEYSESLYDGFTDVSGMGGLRGEGVNRAGLDSGGESGLPEQAVDEDPEEGSSTEDSEAAYHESTEFGALGEHPASAGELQSPKPPTLNPPPHPRTPEVPGTADREG